MNNVKIDYRCGFRRESPDVYKIRRQSFLLRLLDTAVDSSWDRPCPISSLCFHLLPTGLRYEDPQDRAVGIRPILSLFAL